MLKLIMSILILVAMGLAGCSQSTNPPVPIQPGFSRADVRANLGDPDEVKEFLLPEGPFYGPQESLVDLASPGTPIEEWIYQMGEEVQFVWFAGEPDQPIERWTVIETAIYPAGAVY